MNTVGNNISNVNTVGYKAQRMDFQDFVYQYTGTAAGMGQVGRGTSIGIIMNDFMQGSLETTTSATDIAITGNGFFKVRPLTNNESFYTRAGNFTFNRDGFLVDPHGYVLQGWLIDRANQGAQSSTDMRSASGIVGTGAPTDIRLDTFTCPPRHTTNLSLPVNLAAAPIASAGTQDKSTDPVDPFFALLKTWDATQSPPLGSNMYAHQSTIEVYDEGGRLHKLTIYFDRVVSEHQNNPAIFGNSTGETYWEFIVTMDPSSDVRDFSSVFDPTGNTPANANVPDALKGLLGAGVMTFDSSGQMKNMSMFVPNDANPESPDPTNRWWMNDPSGATYPNGAPVQVVDLRNWIPAPISSDGFPMIAPGFSGSPGLQSAYAWDTVNKRYDFTRPNMNITDRMIAVDQGMRITNNQWNFPVFSLNSAVGSAVTASVGGFASGAADAYALNYLAPSASPDPGNRALNAQAAARAAAAAYVAANDGPGTPLGGAATAFGTAANAAWEALGAAAGNDPATIAAVAAAVAAASALSPAAATAYATAYVEARSYTGTPGRNGSAEGNTAVIALAITVAAAAVTNAFSSPVFTDVQAAVAAIPGISGDQATIYATAYGITNGTPAVKAAAAAQAAGITGTAVATAATAAANANTSLPTAAMMGADKFAVNGSGIMGERMPNATTNFGTNSFEHSGKRQDGYTFGDLRFVNVDNNGVLSATYSNGVTLQLFQIALNDFPSLQNLRREGGEPLQRNPRIGPTEHRSARIGGLRHNPRLFPGAK